MKVLKAYQSRVNEYVESVMDGTVKVGKYERLAVERYQYDLATAEDRGWKFVVKRAVVICVFIEQCIRQSMGAWKNKPLILSPFQLFIVWNLFGWVSIETGFRRFRKVYVTLARKNGKTTLAAAIALAVSLVDYPPSGVPHIFMAATKKDQAKICTDECERMVEISPDLRDSFTKYYTHLLNTVNHGKIIAVGRDSKTQDGLNPQAVIKDELHEWGHKHEDLYAKLSTAGGARDQPIELIITTAGSDTSELWIEEDEYACKVVEAHTQGQVIDDRYLSFICRLDGGEVCEKCSGAGCSECKEGYTEGDDIFDESNWRKANPNYLVLLKREYLETQANEARYKPLSLASFRRYHCNLQTSAREKLINGDDWNRCAEEARPIEEYEKMPCYGAIDLGRSDDFAAWALCFPVKDADGNSWYRLEGKTYTCADRPADLRGPMFESWVNAGYLLEHPGAMVDFDVVEADIMEASKTYRVKKWRFDKRFAMQMAAHLQKKFGEKRAQEYPQRPFAYNEPCRMLRKLIATRQIEHDANPLHTWQMGNIVVVTNNEDHWMPDKSSRRNKIDYPVACLMALSDCLFEAANEAPKDFYKTNKLEIF